MKCIVAARKLRSVIVLKQGLLYLPVDMNMSVNL